MLSASSAPVKVIASGSVLFGSSPLDNNTADNQWRGRCSGGESTQQVLGPGAGCPAKHWLCRRSLLPRMPPALFVYKQVCEAPAHPAWPNTPADDWDCYRPAQLNLLHTLQRHAAASKGCYVVITGDYHYRRGAGPGALEGVGEGMGEGPQAVQSRAHGTGRWAGWEQVASPLILVVLSMPCRMPCPAAATLRWPSQARGNCTRRLTRLSHGPRLFTKWRVGCGLVPCDCSAGGGHAKQQRRRQ